MIMRQDVDFFLAAKGIERRRARQRAALQLACGIELEALDQAVASDRIALRSRLERALRRERLKGLRQHWSYDLNRHIALKEVLDDMDCAVGGVRAAVGTTPVLQKKKRHLAGRRRSIFMRQKTE